MVETSIGLMTAQKTAVPLTGVEVRGTITGRAARVKVSQKFRNVENVAIEAVYKFPLPENTALCGFKAVIGDRTIAGEVKERDKAYAEYDDAISHGHGAFLLDEERPNIFTLSVGNLSPEQEVTIEIEYVNLLGGNGAEVRFFLPTTISPRYVPAGMPDEDGIPLRDTVNPVFAPHAGYGLKIMLAIEGKDAIASVECPSHSISSQFSDNAILVEFASGTVDMDRDFVLTVRYQKGFESRGFVWAGDKETFVQADLSFDQFSGPTGPSVPQPQEIVFLLDCSGSMQGSSIAEARTALEVLLRALEDNTTFNIYRFGSTFEKLFATGQTYDAASLEKALDKLAKTQADLGGTEVMGPLRDIYSSPPAGRRAIVLITDGQIGNEGEVLGLVREHARHTRVFTVGIGHGPNEYLIRQVARATGGASEMVAPGERIEHRGLRLYRKVVAAAVTDLVLKAGGALVQAPASPALYEGETLTVLGNMDQSGAPDRITVSGKVGDKEGSWSLPLAPVTSAMPPLPVLWARERIRDLEESGAIAGSRQVQRKAGVEKERIVELSVRYGVISQETSFLAIEKRPDPEKTTGEIVLRPVPVSLTHGWHGFQVMSARISYRAAPQAPMAYTTSAMGKKGVGDAAPSFLRMPIMRFRREKAPSVPLGQPDTRGDILLRILSLQRREGGFEMDQKSLNSLGIPPATVRGTAKRIRAQGEVNGAVLVSTAIALWLLENRFADRKEEWQALVRKSAQWFRDEVARTRPEIDGMKLEDWVADRMGKLHLSM